MFRDGSKIHHSDAHRKNSAWPMSNKCFIRPIHRTTYEYDTTPAQVIMCFGLRVRRASNASDTVADHALQ